MGSDIVTEAPVAVSAHRGGSGDAVAPMLQTYRAGIAAGVDFVEVDVRRTSDGVLVLHHDERLPSGRPVRLASFARYVAELDHRGLRLEELLAVARGEVGLHVDLKEPGYEIELMAVLLEHLQPHEFVVTSVDEESVRAIKEAHPEIQVGLTLGGSTRPMGPLRTLSTRLNEFFPRARIRRCSPDFLAVNYRLAKLTVFRFAAKKNIPLWVWTVDGDRAMQSYLRDPRVSTIVSNRPEMALRLRAPARKPPLSRAR